MDLFGVPKDFKIPMSCFFSNIIISITLHKVTIVTNVIIKIIIITLLSKRFSHENRLGSNSVMVCIVKSAGSEL